MWKKCVVVTELVVPPTLTTRLVTSHFYASSVNLVCFFFIENVLMWFSYNWFLAYVTPFSCFRPSSPKRSRLCLVSWAVRRRSSAQQPGTSDRHPLDALLWLSVRAWELYHVLHSSPIIEYYYRRRPGIIRPKCSFIETISSSENAFRKKWRAANVLTLSKLEGVLK